MHKKLSIPLFRYGTHRLQQTAIHLLPVALLKHVQHGDPISGNENGLKLMPHCGISGRVQRWLMQEFSGQVSLLYLFLHCVGYVYGVGGHVLALYIGYGFDHSNPQILTNVPDR
jgi:hypothetical protein